MGGRWFLMAMFFALLPISLAATIHGNVYDLSLDKVEGATVEVNTTPSQFFIAREGEYSFEIPKGTYLISAKEKANGQVLAIENRTISVLQEGPYVIDFILFPVIEEDTLDNLDLSDVADNSNGGIWGILIIAALLLIAAGIFYWRRNKQIGLEKKNIEIEKKTHQEEDDYLSKTLSIIKKSGGRSTQKDIRKELPLSEAKISLLIAELEHKGRIEKIKKGRGNIIILK
jgi:uncharacterized membrane protein